MPLNDVERVIYTKNPLIEVVCQLRFPRILSINETSPARFQDRIRNDYPIYDVAIEYQQQFAFDTIVDPSTPMQKIIQSEQMKNYRFSSADNLWHINLTSTFISISTSKYTRWEEFLSKFEKSIEALIEIYNPAFYERIGLRYVNAFRKSSFNLNEANWNELLQPYVLGFLSNINISNDIKSTNSMAELDIGSGAIAKVNTGLGLVGNFENSIPTANTEISFLIDSDMFFFRKEISELDWSLNYLHSISTKLIRAMITDKLHNAMEPEII